RCSTRPPTRLISTATVSSGSSNRSLNQRLGGAFWRRPTPVGRCPSRTQCLPMTADHSLTGSGCKRWLAHRHVAERLVDRGQHIGGQIDPGSGSVGTYLLGTGG